MLMNTESTTALLTISVRTSTLEVQHVAYLGDDDYWHLYEGVQEIVFGEAYEKRDADVFYFEDGSSVHIKYDAKNTRIY